MNRIRILDDLDGVGLLLALGHELEGGVVAEVPEVLAGTPADVDGLDVLGGEVVCGDGAFGLEFGMERAEFSEGDLVACEHHFAEAVDGLSEDGCHVASVVGASVVGDVLGELVEVEALVDLADAVSLRLGDVSLECAGLGAHDGDRVLNHSGPLPSSPRRGGVLYSAEGIAGVKG